MKKFKKIYIEITNRCNLTCSFCHQSKRAKAWMSPEDFAEIAGQIRNFTSHIALHVLGEPLLHPNLGQLLAESQRNGLAVNLTTNGTLLPRQQDMLLASPALRQVNISLHSVTGVKTGADLSDYLSGIFSFIRQASATRSLYISLRLWNLQGAGSDSVPLQNEPVLRKIEDFFALPVRLADALTPGHGISLAPKIFLSQHPRFTWPHAPAPELGAVGFCRGLRDHVAILVDGTVVPCCLDAEADISLGNIHDQPLQEILASSRASALHDGFSRRRLVEPLCRRCSFRQGF
ncbi:MAG: radical SAM protein [Pseudomonadota bacterium]